MKTSPEIGELAKAFVAAQVDLKNPNKDQQGYGYKYADLSSIIDSVKPTLKKNGLSIVQLVKDKEAKVGVETILLHESGQYISTTLYLDPPTMKGTSATQNAGAALTYARRYSLSAILNINADEDTDARNKTSLKLEKSDTAQKATCVTCGGDMVFRRWTATSGKKYQAWVCSKDRQHPTMGLKEIK